MTTILAHDSSFHTDDVFAVATLLLVEPDAEVIRSREQEKIDAADYVVDTGLVYNSARKRFDHHQRGGAGVRENGIPYASFGLVWKEYGAKLAGGEREAAVIDRMLVQAIDGHDNGVNISTAVFEGVRAFDMGDFFYSYLGSGDTTPERLYAVFMQVVGIAGELLQREIPYAKKVIEGEDFLKKLYEGTVDKRLIELPTPEEDVPWRRVLGALPEPLYIIYPRKDGKWGMKAVPDLTKPFGHNKKDLPEAWAGKADEELQNITGVKDAVFAHRAGFMAAAKTKEAALQLAQIALNS